MKVYVLQETWPDSIETSVYKKREDAISALNKLVEEEGMEYYEDNEAECEGIYAIVEEKELN
tara:strand:+ start:219 stop:404 length:186 start_codon:yes stop_codon:yes gene_type:complete